MRTLALIKDLFVALKKLADRYSHVNWALADQAMVSGVNFLTGILFARYLGLEEFGRFTLAWMAVLFCNSFQQAGIIAPMMSLGPKQKAEDEPAYYGALIIQQIIWSVFCFFLLWTGIWISGYFRPEWNMQSLGLPLAAALLAWQLQDFVRRYFFVRDQGGLAFLNDAVSYLGQLVLLMVLFHWTTLNTALVLWLIAGTSALAVGVGACRLGSLVVSRCSMMVVAGQHWRFSKWLVASALLQWTSGNFFILSLGALVGPSAVGALRAAQNIIGATHVLFQGLENVVPVGAAKSLHNNGVPGLVRYLKKSVIFCSGSTTLFCLGISIAPELLFSLLYGGEYQGFGYLLWWYAPIYLLMSIGLPLRAGLRALDNTRPIFTAYTIMSTFSLLSAAPLINLLDIPGAMLGILGTQLIFQAHLLICLRRRIYLCDL